MDKKYIDKELKNKLNSLQPSFNPSHWEAMESMLDQRPKRTGFAWLWLFMGVLFTFFGLQLFSFAYSLSSNETILNEEPNTKILEHSNENLLVDNKVLDKPVQSKNNEILYGKGNYNATNTNQTIAKNTSINTQNKQSAKQDLPSSIITGNNKSSITNSDKTKQNKKTEHKKSQLLDKLIQEDRKREKLEGLGLALMHLHKFDDEAVSTNFMATFQKPIESEFDPIEPQILHSLLRWFMQLDAGTNANRFNNNFRLRTQAELKVGLTVHDNLSFAMGLGLRNLSFSNHQPECSGIFSYQCPEAYNADILALAFPIELTYSPLTIKKWKFSATAGYTAYSKLKEEFDYQLPATTDPTIQQSFVSHPPSSTNFTSPVLFGSNVVEEKYFKDQPLNTAEFGLNGGKRFINHASIGIIAQYMLSKRMALLFNTKYVMGLNKVGISDKRLNGFESNLGVRLMMGK